MVHTQKRRKNERARHTKDQEEVDRNGMCTQYYHDIQNMQNSIINLS